MRDHDYLNLKVSLSCFNDLCVFPMPFDLVDVWSTSHNGWSCFQTLQKFVQMLTNINSQFSDINSWSDSDIVWGLFEYKSNKAGS